jgi:hypothetical protein
MPALGFVFPKSPPRQFPIDVPQGRVKSRLIVVAVVVNPAPYYGVEHPSQVIQRLVTASRKVPGANLSPDRFKSLVADCGTERDADSTLPSSRQPRPIGIAEEVKLLVGILSAPVIILAVDDLRLLRMKRQSTFSEPLLERYA